MTDKVQEELNKILKKHKWPSIDKIDWICISRQEKLSEEFIEKFSNKVHWYNIGVRQTLSEEFIEKFRNYLNLTVLRQERKVTLEFYNKLMSQFDADRPKDIDSIKKKAQAELNKMLQKPYWKAQASMGDGIFWYCMSDNHGLSYEFFETFQDKLNWNIISWRHNLSEHFIETFQHRVNWQSIRVNQILSETFREKFKHKLDIDYLLEHNKITQEYLDKPLNPKNRFKLLDI